MLDLSENERYLLRVAADAELDTDYQEFQDEETIQTIRSLVSRGMLRRVGDTSGYEVSGVAIQMAMWGELGASVCEGCDD